MASKLSGPDLDLRPSKVTWGQKYFHHSKAQHESNFYSHFSLYLVLEKSKKFLRVDFDTFDRNRGQKYLHHSKTHNDFLLTFSLYLVPISRNSTLKFLRVDFDLWPLEGHLGSKIFSSFENPYMASYLTSIDTFSLSRTIFEIFDFKIFRVWFWPLTFRDHLWSKIFSPFESPCKT